MIVLVQTILIKFQQECLEKLLIDKSNSNNNQCLLSYDNHSTESKAEFILHFHQDIYDKMKRKGKQCFINILKLLL